LASEDRDEKSRLWSAQRLALHAVIAAAIRLESGAYAQLTAVLHGSECPIEMFEEAMQCIRAHARVAIHFHPDRYGVKPATVAESLLNEGFYQNQFETGLSSGGRTAYPGGDRDCWERDLFGGAYQMPGVSSSERPKYGALALIRYPDGPTPRFGSCYLVLRQGVTRRCTFTFPGSEQALAVERLGTINRMVSVMAALFKEVAAGEGASVPWPPFTTPTLGIKNLTIPQLLNILMQELSLPPLDPSTGEPGRVLDSCVEAQVHGPIDLRFDIEQLVIDSSFDGTPTGEILDEIARKYRFPIYRHCRFQFAADSVPEDFRGPAVKKLAKRIAVTEMVNAAVIGAAEATLYTHPETWDDWGSRDEALQHLKQLWHVVVHYGEAK
jgi:hypothetical protein